MPQALRERVGLRHHACAPCRAIEDVHKAKGPLDKLKDQFDRIIKGLKRK